MLQKIEAQLHIAVCDDEILDCQQIADLTEEILQRKGLACTISTYQDGAELLAAIRKGAYFHILLLDVMMQQMGGMELAAALRRMGDNTAIIFISSNREMAMQGYEVAALRYLGKPIDQERLYEALMFCYKTKLEQKEILLPTKKGRSRVLLSDIVYAETWERGIRLLLREGHHLKIHTKISELAAMLPERQFVFCHRTILVNLDFVHSIRYCELELKTGTTLPVSKYRQTEMRNRLIHYLEE